jgi:hypothetical protein
MKATCPVCGKIADKRSHWKMPDGSYNRLYVHLTKKTAFGFNEVIESCIAREEDDQKEKALHEPA